MDEVNEELKTVRKLANEEKSLKIFAENRSRVLESDLARKNDEIKHLEDDLCDNTRRTCSLEERVSRIGGRKLICRALFLRRLDFTVVIPCRFNN